MQGTKKRRISEMFARWLLLALAVALAITTVFIYVLQTRLAEKNTDQVLKLNIEDVKQDIMDASDAHLLELAHAVAEVLNSVDSAKIDDELLQKIKFAYGLTEVNVIDESGVISESTQQDFLGLDMSSGEQTAEFLVLLNGEKEFVQSYRPISYDTTISRKYAGVALEKGGFVQVGYDADRFQTDIDHQVVGLTKNRHVGTGGRIFICDRNRNIVSNAKGFERQKFDLSSFGVEPGSIRMGERFRAVIDGEAYYCMTEMSEGYYIVALMPAQEAMTSRDVSVYVTGFMMVVVFVILFGIICYLLKRQIVDNVRKINGSLAAITGGDLNTTVDVHTNEEFSSLSDDINTTVDALKQHIEEAAARIDQELEFARSIQLSALNTVFPPYPTRKDFDIYALMDTAREVGGDFYDFYFLNEDVLGIIVADVSGKGVPAAMLMMRAKTLIGSLISSGIPVEEAFARANNVLCENNEVDMFITCWMAIVNLKTGMVSYVNAGHNPPLLRRRDGSFEYLKGNPGFVLAGLEDFRYEAQEMKLEPGDQLYLYTDGVTEATDAQEELFGEERLRAALNEEYISDPEVLCRKIKRAVDEFVGEAPQMDDITMLSLTYKGGSVNG